MFIFQRYPTTANRINWLMSRSGQVCLSPLDLLNVVISCSFNSFFCRADIPGPVDMGLHFKNPQVSNREMLIWRVVVWISNHMSLNLLAPTCPASEAYGHVHSRDTAPPPVRFLLHPPPHNRSKSSLIVLLLLLCHRCPLVTYPIRP